jgi:hypothetical protein
MSERAQTPRNEVGEPPTHTAKETEERLRTKQQAQHGRADRDRTDRQIDEVRSRAGSDR